MTADELAPPARSVPPMVAEAGLRLAGTLFFDIQIDRTKGQSQSEIAVADPCHTGSDGIMPDELHADRLSDMRGETHRKLEPTGRNIGHSGGLTVDTDCS